MSQQSSGPEAPREKAMVSCLVCMRSPTGRKKLEWWWRRCSGALCQEWFLNSFRKFHDSSSIHNYQAAIRITIQVQAKIIDGKLAHLQRLSQRPQNWVVGPSKVVRPWWLQYCSTVMTCKSLRAPDLLGSAQAWLTGDWWAASTSMGLSEITIDFWR